MRLIVLLLFCRYESYSPKTPVKGLGRNKNEGTVARARESGGRHFL